MIYDEKVMKALSWIRQRSERQGDLDKVCRTFVDPGIIDEIDNKNNQIIYGRRGTGKTHVFRVLQYELSKRDNIVACYVDCRTLGSTAQFTDDSLSVEHRSLSLFRDILNEVHNVIFEYIVDKAPRFSDQALEKLDLFTNAYSTQHADVSKATFSKNDKYGKTFENSAGAGVAIVGKMGFDLSSKKSNNDENSSALSFEFGFSEKAFFNTVFHAIENVLILINVELYLLIDEWSSIPKSIQPYLGEFLKKSILPSNKITLKIAAIEHRSNFKTNISDISIGLELGADISTAPSLDSFYEFQTRGEQLKSDFAEMLYLHISNELPFDYLRKHYHVWDGLTLLDSMFERDTFGTLALASEGVIRDLINIFITALSKVHRPKSYEQRTKISRVVIYESAKQWFDKDKFQNLDHDLKERYMKIVRIAVTENKSRYFALPYINSDLKKLNILIDLRVLHQAGTSFSSLVGRMETFNIYNIDFGSYANLLEFDTKSKYSVIPFFDRKSFSKYPDQMESMDKYKMNIELLE